MTLQTHAFFPLNFCVSKEWPKNFEKVRKNIVSTYIEVRRVNLLQSLIIQYAIDTLLRNTVINKWKTSVFYTGADVQKMNIIYLLTWINSVVLFTKTCVRLASLNKNYFLNVYDMTIKKQSIFAGIFTKIS